MRKQKHVLLVLGWYDYRLHKGIAEYAQEHGWHLSANLARERVIPWGWQGDGVLAWLGAGDDLAEFVESVRRPTVDFSLRRPNPRFARVLQDHAHAARLVADHFLTRGFKHFAFFSDAENWSFDERGRGFVAVLKKAGHECAWIKWHESATFRSGRGEWTKRRAWLAAQLKRSPKPLALFAANDHLATDVLESCDAAGLRVPEQVAIVGAGDYLLAADAMRTPLSSVDINLEEQGYEGAALLDRLMRGARPPCEPLRIPAARVVTRKSSDILAVNEPRVGKALRFIRERFREPIGVEDVARAAAMSRRALHQAFLDHLGRAPGEQIRNVRLEHAKKLLAETNHKIAAIAGLSGYQSANSFCVTFTKAEGFSPAAFRKSIRHRA
ncbi:MAG: DNA-binding transcriptional regulator [Verrucomicrobia bacterium]|nr:DNA-binding transcriptional regulator [Verrucomicrobiota bacterium]